MPGWHVGAANELDDSVSRGSKERRDAKRRAERKASARHDGRTSSHEDVPTAGITWHDPEEFDGDRNRMFRKTCPDCGGAITWTDESGAREHGMDVDQALEFIGAPRDGSLEWWICETCGNAGLMGPPALGV
jgi:hypothetical protein